MPFRDYLGWGYYNMIEPFGDRMTQIAIGYLTTLTANMNRGKGKPFQMHEVFPLVLPPAPPSPEALIQKIFQIFGSPPDGAEEPVLTEGAI